MESCFYIQFNCLSLYDQVPLFTWALSGPELVLMRRKLVLLLPPLSEPVLLAGSSGLAFSELSSDLLNIRNNCMKPVLLPMS